MPALELLLVGVALAAALAPLAKLAATRKGARWALGACAALAAAAASVRTSAPASRSSSSPDAVRIEPQNGYVSSNACRSCHPAEYASWHDSYHRSMTQPATPSSVRAPWRGELAWRGQRYELIQRGADFFATLPDPDRASGSRAPVVERRVLMTTGSHHYQAYWIDGGRGNELWQFPFVYHFETARFIPRHDAFLQPETDPVHDARWNSNCVQCHSVAGEPRHELSTDRFDTRAAELGIACEACHGPGQAHVAAHQDPFERYRARHDSLADASIVNPARLDSERSSEVCGQCHSYFVPRHEEEWWQSGFTLSYRPGALLDPSRLVLDYERDHELGLVSDSLDSAFYADGTVRVGGREWNGLKRSACFEQGEGERRISCLSCHDLHGGTRDDQLQTGRDTNATCASCHATEAASATQHSHHAEKSSGNECVNCHMPYTSYALFKSIRSHRITRPRAAAAGAPNACNLCHQDKSLGWTERWLDTWYPPRGAPLSAPLVSVSDDAALQPRADILATSSAGAVGLLAGDAAVRVIFADLFAWQPAIEASGQLLQAELLIEALDDPYAAVRFVAYRSLRRLPGFESYVYDFIAERPERLRMQARARELVSGRARAAAVDPALVRRLVSLRDERPIRISE